MVTTSNGKEVPPDLPPLRINTFSWKYGFKVPPVWPSALCSQPAALFSVPPACTPPCMQLLEVDASHHWCCHPWPPPPRWPPVMGRSSSQISLPHGSTPLPGSTSLTYSRWDAAPELLRQGGFGTFINVRASCPFLNITIVLLVLGYTWKSPASLHTALQAASGSRLFSSLVLSSLTNYSSEVATKDGMEFQPDLPSLRINTFARKYMFDILRERCHPWAAGTGRLWQLYQGKSTGSPSLNYDYPPSVGLHLKKSGQPAYCPASSQWK